MSIFDTFLNYRVFIETLPLILSGLMTTLTLGFTCIAAGFIAGIALAMLRLYAPQPIAFLTVAYIDVFRSIPVLVLLFVVYYALPFAGIKLELIQCCSEFHFNDLGRLLRGDRARRQSRRFRSDSSRRPVRSDCISIRPCAR